MVLKRRTFTKITGLVLLSLSLILVIAMFPVDAYADGNGCVDHKHITNWNNLSQVEAHGFLVDLESPQAALSFGQGSDQGTLTLDLHTTPNFAGETVASRVTEIDTSVPPAQRVKCWQPASNRDIVVEFAARFDQANPPFGLTETMFLWNAPFGSDPIPLTAIGVTRSLDLTTGQPEYSAIVAQNLVFAPQFSGVLVTQPMPAWLDDSQWHKVRIVISDDSALISVSQGIHPYTTVLQVSLTEPPEPLGVEFSLDNEVYPGLLGPVYVPDGLNIGYFDIRLSH